MINVKRIDPPGCACTDCITGYSVPLNHATLAQLDDMIAGHLQDATGVTEFDFDRYLYHAVALFDLLS